jgi:hypothetical protein
MLHSTTPLLSLLAALVAPMAVVAAAESKIVDFQAARAGAALATTWGVPEDQQSTMTFQQEEDRHFLRIRSETPMTSLIRITVPVPEGATSVSMEYTVRIPDLTRGEKYHMLPRLAVQWPSDVKYENQQVVDFKSPKTEWITETMTTLIPAGAKALKFHAGLLACSGTMDIASVRIVAK